MKKYLFGILFLIVVLTGPSFAQGAQVPTMKSLRLVGETPVLDITSPSDGSTVSGLFTISAEAWDNVAVTKVGFCVSFPDDDYYCVPGGDTSAPYEVSLDSRNFPDGLNDITVIARDAAGHKTDKRISVLIDNDGSDPVPDPDPDPDPVPDPGTVNNIYLDNNGSGDGSIGNPYGRFSEIPWSKIQSWVDSGYAVNINLKRGVTWNELLSVGASGTSGNRITIQAYGTGAAPIIDGYGERYALRLDNQGYVTVDGIELYRGFKNAAVTYGSNNIIQNCYLHDSEQKQGIFITGQTNSIIQNNLLQNIGSHGIYLDPSGGGVRDLIIQYNEIHNVGVKQSYSCSAIQMNANGAGYIYDTIIRYNKFHGGSSGGAVAEGGGLRSQIYGNLIYGGKRIGMAFFVDIWNPSVNTTGDLYTYTAKNASVYNNTFYMPSGSECIRVNHKSNGHTFKNNIFYKGGDSEACINVMEGSIAEEDNNICYNTSGAFNSYQGTTYTSLNAWRNGTPFSWNSIDTNPDFTNAGNDDFTLQSTSPAKTGADEDYNPKKLSPLSSWPDNVILTTDPDSIGAYGY